MTECNCMLVYNPITERDEWKVAPLSGCKHVAGEPGVAWLALDRDPAASAQMILWHAPMTYRVLAAAVWREGYAAAYNDERESMPDHTKNPYNNLTGETS